MLGLDVVVEAGEHSENVVSTLSFVEQRMVKFESKDLRSRGPVCHPYDDNLQAFCDPRGRQKDYWGLFVL